MPTNVKRDYQQDVELKLKKLRSRITALEIRVEKTGAGIRTRHDQKMSQIRGYYAQTKEKLEELQEASRENWLDLRPELDRAIGVLDEAVEIMSRRISVSSSK